jgi:hypothetical protein
MCQMRVWLLVWGRHLGQNTSNIVNRAVRARGVAASILRGANFLSQTDVCGLVSQL